MVLVLPLSIVIAFGSFVSGRSQRSDGNVLAGAPGKSFRFPLRRHWRIRVVVRRIRDEDRMGEARIKC